MATAVHTVARLAVQFGESPGARTSSLARTSLRAARGAGGVTKLWASRVREEL